MFKKDPTDMPPIGWGSEAQAQKQLAAMWPKDPSGQPEQAAFLAHIPDFNNEADLAVNMLTAYGIPAFKSYNNEGSLGKLIIGTSAYGASLYVPASLLEDARALLDAPEEEIDAAFSQGEESETR